MRLLVVEDEPDLLKIIGKRLEAEGYGVDLCADGNQALDYIYGASYDAVVMDIMLPGIDGLEVLRRLRAKKNPVPVLLLTARDATPDRVEGLNTGADDYMTKPFSFDELIARLRALMRRKGGEYSSVLELEDLKLDMAAHSVTRAGRPVTLSAKEYSVLEYMLMNKGIVLSRQQIEEHIWNYDFEGGSNVVDVYMRYLRKKLDDGFDKKLIHTVRGSGYVLRGE